MNGIDGNISLSVAGIITLNGFVRTVSKLESDDTSVSLPAPQARPKKKITVAPVDDSQLKLL